VQDVDLDVDVDLGVGVVLTRKHCWTEGENDVEGVKQTKNNAISSIIEPVGHTCVTIMV